MSRLTIMQNGFMERVEKDASSCWLWTGTRYSKGYGTLMIDGKNWLAHRAAYELFVGAIPDGLTIDHLCRVRHCVNPEHLEPVTNAENIRRGFSPSAINARKTHCDHGHEYTPENTRITTDGARKCRICNRAEKQRWEKRRHRRRRPGSRDVPPVSRKPPVAGSRLPRSAPHL